MAIYPFLPDALRFRRPEVASIRDQCGVPFDWAEFCRRLGIRVYKGTVFHNGRGRCDCQRDIIYLDERMSPTLMRSIAAHEIAHLIVPSDKKTLVANTFARGLGHTLTGQFRVAEEDAAEQVAASLLVSPEAIMRFADSSDGSILKLICEIKFGCDVFWQLAIQSVLQACDEDNDEDEVVAEIAPGLGNNLDSPPCVVTVVGQSGQQDQLPISIGLSSVDTSFEDLSWDALEAGFIRCSSDFSLDLPRPVDLRRVSTERILTMFQCSGHPLAAAS